MSKNFIAGAAPSHRKMQITKRNYTGHDQTVNAMARMAFAGQGDPAVRQHALRVIREVEPKDYLSELAALYFDTCRRVRYTRDPIHMEMVAHPRVTLQQRSGDCDDFSVVLATFHHNLRGKRPLRRQGRYMRRVARALGDNAARSMSVGNDAEFVLVGFVEGRGPSHVFARFKDPTSGDWVVVDPVAGPNTQRMLDGVKSVKRYSAHSGARLP